MRITLLPVWAFALTATAFWRMECHARVGLARLDPLVSPGEVSQHVHAIHGSSGFSEDATYEDLVRANCTSCAVTQDKSVYWHPSVLFQDASTGEFEAVDQRGGMLAYYLLYSNPGEKSVKAFPQGFRMIAGDSLRRNYSLGDVNTPDPEKSLWAALGQVTQGDLAQRALGFNCLNYQKAPEGSLYRHFLPDKAYLDANCPDGIRFELMFPSCWNGKDLDSPNHKDHVAYPDLVMTGTCPPDYPIRLVSLFYETIWATDAFKNRPGKFVISNGDPYGYGYHGDFMTGWDPNFLQQAVDTCTSDSGMISACPLFDIQDDSKANQCKMDLPAALVNEDVRGPGLKSLPGNVAIQYGPGPATMAHPPQPSSVQAVPTLTYKPGSSATASGTYLPGQVFKATAEGVAQDQPTSTPPPQASAAQVQPPVAPQVQQVSVESAPAVPPTPAPVPPPPATTPPAQLPAAQAAGDGLSYEVVRTEYVTNGNIVSEIVWQEAVVYVTVSEDVTSTVTVSADVPNQVQVKARRIPGHMHRHAGRQHGHRS